MTNPHIQVRSLTRTYSLGPEQVAVLRDLDLDLVAGEALAVIGPSGSGKSTLLHILGTLDRPSSGSVTIGGLDPFTLPEPELARFRNREVGFVFQDHHLLPQYTALENVLIPTLPFRRKGEDPEPWARELLGRVGLEKRLAHRPAELSGGERQRVAVARALIHRPRLLLADEPTGNLDEAAATGVADLLFELQRELGAVLVLVTHSLELAARFPRRCRLASGRCVAA
ncbi:MAG: ABC transporter ATP-binding protein [Thermoanaerobaculia bacterium]|nr:ABC transporter ATP-binding protein [Thermoanaerobaculia bacterium]